MKTNAEDATDRIRSLILGGRFPPGTHLQEVPLAAMLGYSRTPIRTALNSLALQGLLHYRPNGGYQVRRFTVDEIVEAYEVRATLEGMACRLAAERGVSAAARERMQSSVAGMEALFEQGEEGFDRAQWRSMNQDLHNAIVESAGSRTLADFVEQAQLGPMASPHVIATMSRAGSVALIHRAQVDHVHIVDAILRGQSSRAEARMREHLHIAGENLRAELLRDRATAPETDAAAARARGANPHD